MIDKSLLLMKLTINTVNPLHMNLQIVNFKDMDMHSHVRTRKVAHLSVVHC